MTNAKRTNELPFPASAGMPYGSGFVVGRVEVTGVSRTLIRAPRALGHFVRVPWSEGDDSEADDYVVGARSLVDGLTNTMVMALADSGNRVAEEILSLRIGGRPGWHIPAIQCLDLCYRQFRPSDEYYRIGRVEPPATRLPAFQAGGIEAFEATDAFYWSSTESIDTRHTAWARYFATDRKWEMGKQSEGNMFAVRFLDVDEEMDLLEILKRSAQA